MKEIISSTRGWIASQFIMASHIARYNSFWVVLKVFLNNTIRRRVVLDLVIHGECIQIRTATPDIYVAMETLGAEFEILAALRFDSAPFIIDAGAYIGTAAIALKKIFPKSVVICVEPSQDNFQFLQRNTERFPGVFVIRGALVQDGGPQKVHLHNSKTGPWGFEVLDRADAAAEEVDTVTLRQLLERFEQGKVNICKMDIEGSEEPLLAMYEGWLDYVDALAIELHDRKRPGIQSLFDKATAKRLNLKLPGEKVLSLSPDYLAGYAALSDR